MSPYVEVRFESDHEAVFDIGKVSILPLEARPGNATENGARLHEEWRLRRGPKPVIEGESREIEGVMVHVCAMTSAEVESFANGWKMLSGHEYIATVPRFIRRLDPRGRICVDVVENGTRVMLERIMSIYEADGPWTGKETIRHVGRAAARHREAFASMRGRST